MVFPYHMIKVILIISVVHAYKCDLNAHKPSLQYYKVTCCYLCPLKFQKVISAILILYTNTVEYATMLYYGDTLKV